MTRSWIVVLNWNGRDDTLELLADLEAADLPQTTVLVVDNASTDGTLDAVHADHPWVRTLQTGANLGYAGGNNRGIELALSAGAQVVCVLNNDTRVPRDFWPPLVEQAFSGTVAVSPDIRYQDSPDDTWFYGGISSPAEGYARHLTAAEQPARTGPTDTDVLTGCCLVASAEVWQRVGLFDERLFLIFEDSDWSLRARAAGVRLLLEPRSRIRHKVSRSFAGSGVRLGLYYYCRNGTVFAARWLGLGGLLRFVVGRVVREGLRDLRRSPATGARDAALRGVAVVAAATGRRGPAGRLVRRLAGAAP